MSLFSERLKKLREEKSVSRNELAEELNVSTQTIANYENGNREPNFDNLIKLADYFKVTTDYLIGRSDFRTWEEEIEFKNIKLIELENIEQIEKKEKIISTLLQIRKKTIELLKIDYIVGIHFISLFENIVKLIEEVIIEFKKVNTDKSLLITSTIDNLSLDLEVAKVKVFANTISIEANEKLKEIYSEIDKNFDEILSFITLRILEKKDPISFNTFIELINKLTQKN
ncbi:DNA-binding transcriptional regulator, XRE-family HTH domain [Caloramator fervidus]|uniref:DNA-binding transcriptional regulator, XRE-family HTH domain n=1 Tax=Caloramator fervidus TaxID=29344 RepID=A0A1H5XFF1_9CLOT|nr:helix-turn-helix transcriptional regulator [Caloramator fervidus]SEG10077.1 DNA-binding transcriptional regulator, XRE-family HTH domain [Caloramator fervidus]